MPKPTKPGKKPPVTIQPTNPGPTDEPGQQPTPDADALGEVEAVLAGVGLNLAEVSAQLASAATDSARSVSSKFLGRDAFDTDIGYHEGLRHLTLHSLTGLTAMNNMFQFTAGIKAMDNQTIAHQRDSDDAYYGGLAKGDATFHQSLLKSYGIETDNEVLTTQVLAKLVERINGIEQAIVNAGNK
jgi:hypothetical protein